MKNSRPHRIASRLTSAIVLASWPLIGSVACSVYDASMVSDAASLAGAPEAGTAGSSLAGGTSAGSGAGSVDGGNASGASGGTVAGKAGDSAGGSGGSGATGGGGSASGGGSGSGSGGSAGVGGGAGSGNTELIDDMEDGDAEIELTGPRNGYWYVGSDTTAGGALVPPSTKFEMTELAAGDRSSYAAHVKATGFTDWGSVMGFNFIELLTKVKPYDASAFCGVQFWGKAAATTKVRLRVPDIDTHQSGGVCTDPGTTGTACYDHFGTPVSLGTTWQQFSVKFSDLTQVGTGYHPADGLLKTDQLMALEWALPASSKTFEIWIDDVAFTKCN